MPSPRKQQKPDARRSRECVILSDIENKDVMIGNPNFGDLNEEKILIKAKIEALELVHLKRMKSGVKIGPTDTCSRQWLKALKYDLKI